jgi:hypothetical protein
MAKLVGKTLAMVEAAFDAGSAVSLAEYRFTDNKPFDWMDKETGEAKSMTSVKHTVEVGNKAILLVDADVKDTAAALAYKCPFKKGQMVLVVFKTMGYVKGKGEVYRGTLLSIEA